MDRPAVTPPGPWSFPDAERTTLPNGLSVLAFHRPGQHVVSVGLHLDVPLSVEPRDLEGVAALTSRALDEGTHTLPGTEFADAVESCGAVIDAGVSHSQASVSLDVPGRRLGQAAKLMAQMVAEPQLSDADVERHRRIRVAQLRQQLSVASERASLAARHALIDPAARAQRLAGGEAGTLDALTGEDARAYHARWFGPRGASLVIAGDLGTGDVDAVADAFSSWANPTQESAAHERVAGRAATAVLVDRPGSVQADIRLGWFSIDRNDPRWAALQIATNALGGAYLSRLNRVLREEKGFTYGASLVNLPLRSGGLTWAQGSFRTEVVGEALSLMPGLLDVRDEPITDAEVTRARDYLLGVTPLRFATASGLCDGVLGLLAGGLGLGFVDAQRDAWLAITPADATAAAEQLVVSDAGTLVVVGDAEALEPQLRAAGWEPTVVAAD